MQYFLLKIFFNYLGSLFSQHNEQQQQLAQVPTGLQQQILQISPIQTSHAAPIISTPVPIQPKPSLKPIAPSTMNPSITSHKQSLHSKVNINFIYITYSVIIIIIIG